MSGARPLDLNLRPQAFEYRSGGGAPMMQGQGWNPRSHMGGGAYLGGSGGGSGTFGGYRGGGSLPTGQSAGPSRPTYEGTLFGLANGVPRFRAPNYSDGIENG